MANKTTQANKPETMDVFDAIEIMREYIEDANFLAQALTENYFDNFDPDTDARWIAYDFKRRRAYAHSLEDCIKKIARFLPPLKNALQEFEGEVEKKYSGKRGKSECAS